MNEEAFLSPSSGFFSPEAQEMAKEPLSFAYEAPHHWHSKDDVEILPILTQDLQNLKSFLFLQSIKSTGRPLNSMVKLENTIGIRSRCRKDPPHTCSFLTGEKLHVLAHALA